MLAGFVWGFLVFHIFKVFFAGYAALGHKEFRARLKVLEPNVSPAMNPIPHPILLSLQRLVDAVTLVRQVASILHTFILCPLKLLFSSQDVGCITILQQQPA